MPNITYPVPFLENYTSSFVNQLYPTIYMLIPRIFYGIYMTYQTIMVLNRKEIVTLMVNTP